MIPQIPPHLITEDVSPDLQPSGYTPKPSPLSVADLFGLGMLVILTLLVSRQLVIRLYTRYQLHRFIASLQQMATLERQLQRRMPQATPKTGLFH